MTHRAGANYGYRFNRWRTAYWVAHALKTRPAALHHARKPPSSTTSLTVVILYAQPKRLYSLALDG
jgi:hypothetical protein